MRPIARLTDKCNHGVQVVGQIIEASTDVLIGGLGVARVGDKVSGHGNHPPNVIVDGDPSVLINGRPMAVLGSKTSCGAIISTGYTLV